MAYSSSESIQLNGVHYNLTKAGALSQDYGTCSIRRYIMVKICKKKGFFKGALGPIAQKVAHLTSYCFVASPFETKLAHELLFILVVC